MSEWKPKLFSSMKTYSSKQFAKDVVAGIIVAIIALPLSIALAIASGVAPEQGLYTAIVAGFFIALLGGSSVQISGPTAAFATVVAGIVAQHGMSGLAIATIMAGVLLILMGILRMGSLIKFIPYTITTGFTAGIAVTIVIGQIKDFLGLRLEKSPIETTEKFIEAVKGLSTINLHALFVGLVCLTILILWPKINKVIPGSLIAVLVGIGLVKGMDLRVNTIGNLYNITSGLPKFTAPTISFDTIHKLFPDAVTIAILAAVESLLSCVVSDGMCGSRHQSNTELIGQGCGNILSALFGGIPATGAIARTAANVKNGGRTPVAGMVHAVVLLLILVLLMPYAKWIPMPTIAAILFMVAYNMSEWRSFVKLCKTSPRSDILVLVLTFVLTVVFDLVVAIEVGLLVAVIFFMKHMAETTKVSGWEYFTEEEIKNDENAIGRKLVPSNTQVFEIIGPMFFGAAEKFTDFPIERGVNVLILRMRGVPVVDATAMRSLNNVLDHCKRNEITLVLSHLQPQPKSVLEKSGFLEKVGADNICANIDAALERAAQLGKK